MVKELVKKKMINILDVSRDYRCVGESLVCVVRDFGFLSRHGRGGDWGPGGFRDIGGGGISILGGNRNGNGGFGSRIMKMYRYNRMTSTHKAKPLMPPNEERIFAIAVEEVLMMFEVALPIDPTTDSSKFPIPLNVSRMPMPIDRII